MSAKSTLIVCPRCNGGKMIDNGARDPQLSDDTECPRCAANGVVREPLPPEPLSAEWQQMLDASIAQAKRLRESDRDPQVDRLLAQELADRDREWWA